MGNLSGYLTKDEEVKLQWQGGLTSSETTNTQRFKDQLEGGTKGRTTFAATTKRLVLLDGSSSFKDIDNSHISSVEVDKSTEPDLTPVQWVATLGLLAAGGGVLGIFSTDFGLGFLGLIIGGGMFGAAWMMVEKPSELFDISEKTTYEIKVITGDEADQQIEFETEENVGADLSRIVREYS